MNTELLFALVIFLLTLVCFKFALNAVFELTTKKKIAIVVSQDVKKSKLEQLCVVSERLFFRPASTLLRFSFVKKGAENLCVLLTLRGKKATLPQVTSFLFLVSIVACILGLIVSGSPVFGISAGLCTFVGILTFSGSHLTKATNDMREQVPDAIQCMANCTASGFSLMQTFEQAEKECAGPLGRTFELAHKRMKLGSSVDEALLVFDSVKAVPELKFISVAFRVQHVAGGPISEVLECARQSVLSELELARTLRVQTTQAKMSATIVTLMPFVLLALFSFMSPGFLTPFFSSLIGIAIFCIAFAMQATGVLMVRKTLSKCEG